MVKLTFVPFFRKRSPIEATGDREKQGELLLKVAGKSNVVKQSVPLQFHFHGPSDVQRINPSAIARVEPPLGTNDFEPNYFPFMEFRDPDFLWRYSLSGSEEEQQPWLALLAFSMQELDDLSSENRRAFRQGGEGDWVLDLIPELLPQDRDVSLDSITGHMQREGSRSRLFCLRRLKPETSYMLFLVPYYLGDGSLFDIEEQTTVPVYYHSRFMTSEKGDFEFLARRLKVRPVPAHLGTTQVHVGESKAHREGALAAPGYTASGRESYREQPRAEEIYDELAQAIDTPGEDPYVTLPYYGRQYQGHRLRHRTEWEANRAPQHWSEELNLDLRNRISAGLGTRVIQKEQNEYLKQCWFQVGDLRLANEKIARAQGGLQLMQSLDERYIQTLSDDAFFILSRPFQSHFAYKETGRSESIKKRLNRSGLPHGVAQPAFLKIARQRLSAKRLPLFAAGRMLTPPSGMLRRWNRSAKVEWIGGLEREIKLPQVREDPIFPPLKSRIPVDSFDIAEARAKFDVKKVVRTKVRAQISINDSQKTINDALDPIVVSPTIPEAMYRKLQTLSFDYILPGIQEIPMNSITLLEENRYFIESFFCGLNDEMGKELAWNQFPIEQKGTIFRQFWDPATVEEGELDELGAPQGMRDIRPLHLWKQGGDRSYLGGNPTEAAEGQGRIVLLLKGDLLRRYPETIVFALKKEESSETTIPPVFRAQIGPDIVGIGFPFTLEEIEDKEYYFVLREPQGAPRFGLDEEGRGDDSPYIENFASDVLHGASLAQATLQRPIQIKIHVTQMLEENNA